MKNYKKLLVVAFSILLVLLLQSFSGDDSTKTEKTVLSEEISVELVVSPIPPPPGFDPGYTELTSHASKSITINGSGSYRLDVVNNSGIYVSLLGNTGNGSVNITLPVTFTVSCTQSGTKSTTLLVFDGNDMLFDMADVVSFQ